MLKYRILTGAILAPLIIFGILKLPYEWYALVVGVFILLAAWEWANLAGVHSAFNRIVFVGFVATALVGFLMWPALIHWIAELMENMKVAEYSGVIDWLVIIPVVWWICISVALRHYPDKLLRMRPKRRTKIIVGWFVLVMAWLYLTRLHFYGVDVLLFFYILIWCADITAYFAGRFWGKEKLSPQISPGKTVAGLYGAFAATICYAIAAGLYYEFSELVILNFVILSLLTVVFSVTGDLFESLAKRYRGVKDSGKLLPGHGGILDRIDSIIAAIPIFYLGVLLMREGYL